MKLPFVTRKRYEELVRVSRNQLAHLNRVNSDMRQDYEKKLAERDALHTELMKRAKLFRAEVKRSDDGYYQIRAVYPSEYLHFAMHGSHEAAKMIARSTALQIQQQLIALANMTVPPGWGDNREIEQPKEDPGGNRK